IVFKLFTLNTFFSNTLINIVYKVFLSRPYVRAYRGVILDHPAIAITKFSHIYNPLEALFLPALSLSRVIEMEINALSLSQCDRDGNKQFTRNDSIKVIISSKVRQIKPITFSCLISPNLEAKERIFRRILHLAFQIQS